METNGEGEVVITLKDVYMATIEQSKILTALHGRLDIVVTKHQSHDEWFDDHEQRIRDLEKFRWQAVGIASVVGSIVGIVASKL